MFKIGDRVISTGYYEVRGTIRAVKDYGGIYCYDIVWDTDHHSESLNAVAIRRNVAARIEKEIGSVGAYEYEERHLREIDAVTRLAELEGHGV